MRPKRTRLTNSLRGIACCVLLLTTAVAQRDSGFTFETWSVEQGLPNSSVTSIAQTPDGYVWIGTFNGIARFDGVRFVTFAPPNTPALKHPRAESLFVDAAGTLWVNTLDGALLSLRNGVFRVEWAADQNPAGTFAPMATRSGDLAFVRASGELLRKPLNSVEPGKWHVAMPPVDMTENALYCEDGAGTVWCLTRDSRVWRVEGTRFTEVASEESIGGKAVRISVDPQGAVWLRTGEDLLRWDGSRFRSITPATEGGLSLRFAHFPRDGGVWMVANDRFRKADDGRWVTEVPQWQKLLGTEFSFHQEICEDSSGGLWFAPARRGLFYLSHDLEPFHWTTASGLTNDTITCLFEDREGNLWIGSHGGGLTRLRKKRITTIQTGDERHPAPAMSVSQAPDSRIWAATQGDGLYVGGGDGLMRSGGANAQPLVFSIVADRAGRVWASAGAEDLHLVIDGQLRPAPWPVHGIKVLFVDSADRLWIGTKEQLLCIADGKLQTFEEFSGANRRDVRAIAEDLSGVLWIGAGSGKLYRYENGTFTAFDLADGAVRYPVWSVRPDNDQSLWIGTFGGGLLHFKNGRYTRFTKSNGLPDDVICQILDDDGGNLWLGSHQGIFRVAKADLKRFAEHAIASVPTSLIGRQDGLVSLECTGGYQPSACRTADGTLWFATRRGFAAVSPAKLAASSTPATPVIEAIVVDGAARDLSASGGRETPVVISPGTRHLEFQYTGLCFAAPDQVRFRYRLDGLETGWNEAGRRRFAQYSFLRPGTYRFQLAACSSDGVWSESGVASVTVQALPHFWQTWWFLGLGSAGVLAGIGLGVQRVSTARLRRKLQGLERQRAIEQDRARIARDIHDDLGAGLTQITLASELLRRAPDQAGEHLAHISRTANDLTLAMDEIVWAVNPKHDTLESLVSYTCSFAQEFLRSAGLRCRLEVPTSVPPARVASETRHNLLVSAKEALNNVVKHASASEVHLRITVEQDWLALTIEDDGRGVLSNHAAVPSPARAAGGNGVGNMGDRMSAVGGTCEISVPVAGHGTRVTFRVPLHIPGT